MQTTGTDISLTDISGYILAGGKSRRMGSDKRTLLFRGMTLLERACLTMEALLGKPPALVGDNLHDFRRLGLRIIPDAEPDCGPVGGIVSALRDCGNGWALFLPVDMPLMTTEVLLELLFSLKVDDHAAVFCDEERIHPLPLILSTDTLPIWKNSLQKKELKLQNTFNEIPLSKKYISRNYLVFQNFNCPTDYGYYLNY